MKPSATDLHQVQVQDSHSFRSEALRFILLVLGINLTVCAYIFSPGNQILACARKVVVKDYTLRHHKLILPACQGSPMLVLQLKKYSIKRRGFQEGSSNYTFGAKMLQ